MPELIPNSHPCAFSQFLNPSGPERVASVAQSEQIYEADAKASRADGMHWCCVSLSWISSKSLIPGWQLNHIA
jgi:hypothetical protein